MVLLYQLTDVAVSHPKAAYAELARILQFEWFHLQRVIAAQMVLTNGNLVQRQNGNEAVSTCTRSLISKPSNPAGRNTYAYQTGSPDNAG